MKTCPIASHFCQSGIKILQNAKLTLNILPNLRNFAKSCHTDLKIVFIFKKNQFYSPFSIFSTHFHKQPKFQQFLNK